MDTRPNLAGVTGLNLLHPLVGKTWKSTFSGPRGTPVTDVCRWERALNGKSVKSRHSIEQVRGTTAFFGADSYRVSTEYLQNGEWKAGRVAEYVRDDTAVVRLP